MNYFIDFLYFVEIIIVAYLIYFVLNCDAKNLPDMFGKGTTFIIGDTPIFIDDEDEEDK